jgi:hypothetical protein
MIEIIFPFLKIQETLAWDLSWQQFLFFNSHVIIYVYSVIILIFRKVLPYSYRVLMLDFIAIVIVVAYIILYLNPQNPAGYEYWGLWFLLVGFSILAVAGNLTSLLIDYLHIEVNKKLFHFWVFESCLRTLALLWMLYFLIALLLFVSR